MNLDQASLRRRRGRMLLVLTPVCLALLAWTAWLVTRSPYAGIQRIGGGYRVEQLSPTGPAAGILEVGDRILAVEGVPAGAATRAPGRLHPGDSVQVTVWRGGRTLELAVPLGKPPARAVWRAFAPLLVGFSFIVLGAAAFSRAPVEGRSVLYFLLCHVAGAGLGFGTLDLLGHTRALGLFYLLTWFSAPLIVHLHLSFPEDRPGRARRPLLVSLYALAAAGSLPLLLWDSTAFGATAWYGPLPLGSYVSASWEAAAPQAAAWFGAIRSGARLSVVAAVLAAATLLLGSCWRASSAEARRQARTVLLSGVLALALFSALCLLPDALWRRPLIPFEVGFLLLLAVPLSYGYALARLVSRAVPLAPP